LKYFENVAGKRYFDVVRRLLGAFYDNLYFTKNGSITTIQCKAIGHNKQWRYVSGHLFY